MAEKDSLAQIKALGESKDSIGAVDKLADKLDIVDDATRVATVAALRSQLARADYTRLLDDKKTPLKTVRNVLKTMRYLKEPRFVPMVVKALGHSDAGIRAEAALVLTVFGAQEAERELITALSDADKNVRYMSADALGTLKSDAAKAAIAERKKVETDPTVTYALIEASKKQDRAK